MLIPVFNYYYIRRRLFNIKVEYPVTEERYKAAKERISNNPKETKKLWRFLDELPGKAYACPYCEQTISTQDKFCKFCGKEILNFD